MNELDQEIKDEISKKQLLYEQLKDEMREEREKLNYYIKQNDRLLEENKRLKHLMYIYELVIEKLCEKKKGRDD